MPFDEKGMWLPAPPGRLSLLWQTTLKYLAVLLSTASLIVSALAYRTATSGLSISQRAYVFHSAELLNAADLATAVKQKAPVYSVGIHFVTKNLGNTPALSVDSLFDMTIPAKTCVKMSGTQLWTTKVNIGPKDSSEQTLWFEYKPCEGKLETPFSTSYTGSLDYLDVFGAKHSTPVCYTLFVTDEGALLSHCDPRDTQRKFPVNYGEWTVDEAGKLIPKPKSSPPAK
jgi:hypothetical protein